MLPNQQINLGLVDFLTGINNRRYFDERLPKEISHSKRYRKPLSCLFIGIDCFEQYKKDYGHVNGDKILKQVAHKIWRGLRATDIVGRYSEEEFAVLLIEADVNCAHDVAKRIQQTIQGMQIELAGNAIQITISIGISDSQQLEKNHQSTKSLGELMLATADRALHSAKKCGRNQVQCIQLIA
ncbi:MAG: GGDEF domain-containing protein [Nitrosomonas sp.]|nr:MAG: GGDEF domain-containing protein [Nitrosomonas sp.]